MNGINALRWGPGAQGEARQESEIGQPVRTEVRSMKDLCSADSQLDDPTYACFDHSLGEAVPRAPPSLP